MKKYWHDLFFVFLVAQIGDECEHLTDSSELLMTEFQFKVKEDNQPEALPASQVSVAVMIPARRTKR